MRWLAVLLLVPALSGCLSFLDDAESTDPLGPAKLGYDPASITIHNVQQHEFSVTSFDNVTLQALVYEPLTNDALADETAPTWPIVMMLHPWGGDRYSYTGDLTGGRNMMQIMAEKGVLVVSYDARGWGESGGRIGIAGPAEMEDLDAVLDDVERRFATNEYIGVIGKSYGGGQSLLALAQKERIDTAVGIQTWSDLAAGIVPNNVPKGEWIASLVAAANAQRGGGLNDEVNGWLVDVLQRQNMDEVNRALESRSSRDALGRTDKPMFQCHGLQDTLFDQALETHRAHAGFTRTFVFTGGHGTSSSDCWDKSIDWLLHFIGGRDKNVAGWPEWVSVDADGSDPISFAEFPETVARTYYLREPDLTAASYEKSTFQVRQMLASNPIQEPGVLWDYSDQTFAAIPEQFRQDPSSVFFASAPFDQARVILGISHVRLYLAENNTDFQITANLYHVQDGNSRLLGRGAVAALDETHVVHFTFPYMKANMDPGSYLVLRLGANEATMWMQYPGNYAVDFLGTSSMTLPFFE